MKTLGLFLAIVTAPLIGCGGDDEKGVSTHCKELAFQNFDLTSYISWSIGDRAIGVVTALPCSTEVAIPGINGLVDCDAAELEEFWDVIALPQFVAGWDDLTDANGSPVQPTAVDSFEVFMSDYQAMYAAGDCPDPDGNRVLF